MVFWFIIEHTMLPIFFLVVLGYFLDKKFHLDVKTLSKLMFFLVIPSFIFTNIYTTQFPATSINIIAAIAVFMVICFIIANIVARIRHYDAAMLESCRNAFMFNNTEYNGPQRRVPDLLYFPGTHPFRLSLHFFLKG